MRIIVIGYGRVGVQTVRRLSLEDQVVKTIRLLSLGMLMLCAAFPRDEEN